LARQYESLNLPEDGKWPSILCFVVGVIYLTGGLAQILTSVGIVQVLPGANDLLGGFLLVIVSSVFLTGVRPLKNNEEEGYAYIAVGYILAAILFVLQIFVIGTNALGWFLRFEDWLSWNLMNDLTLPFWLFIGLLMSTGALWLVGDLRNRATLHMEGRK
jgi:hypothetical protein